MRRYDDPVEVRKGWVTGVEGPEQFWWRGRLWQVRAVVAHWVETPPWWRSSQVQAVIGSEQATGAGEESVASTGVDLVAERELWRVEARRNPDSRGVFDLSFDWSNGHWQLVGCAD